jgi:REP element-mobilizing transposase RayT
MKYNPDKHHRGSLRLRGYDYARDGAYFITVCAQERQCLFGEVVDGKIRLNASGRMVQAVWEELSIHYPGAKGDRFVVMPNHFHGIIVLVGAGPSACPVAGLPPVNTEPHRPDDGQPRGVAPTMSLPDVVHRFKTLTTKRYADGVKQLGWIPFPSRLWQRNYYEHIVRDEESLNRIRQYILDNPARWPFDQENPMATAPEPEDAWHG